MKYRIVHRTEYQNSHPVSVGHNEAWLTPRDTDRQRVLSHVIDIDPAPSTRGTLTDYFGNTVTQFLFNQGYDALTISATNEVEIIPAAAHPQPGPAWESVIEEVRLHATPEALDAYEFTFDSPRCRRSSEFSDYVRAVCLPGLPVRTMFKDLLTLFDRDFEYQSGSTTVSTPVEQVFRQRRGVCQDFAHLMISMLRSLGFAVRYVSGYLRTIPAPGQPRMVGTDASHAWISVYAGPLGWIDLDPTNCSFPSTDHITLAWGRDYTDVAPVKGVYIGGSSPQLHVSVDVCPIDDVA